MTPATHARLESRHATGHDREIGDVATEETMRGTGAILGIETAEDTGIGVAAENERERDAEPEMETGGYLHAARNNLTSPPKTTC